MLASKNIAYDAESFRDFYNSTAVSYNPRKRGFTYDKAGIEHQAADKLKQVSQLLGISTDTLNAYMSGTVSIQRHHAQIMYLESYKHSETVNLELFNECRMLAQLADSRATVIKTLEAQNAELNAEIIKLKQSAGQSAPLAANESHFQPGQKQRQVLEFAIGRQHRKTTVREKSSDFYAKNPYANFHGSDEFFPARRYR